MIRGKSLLTDRGLPRLSRLGGETFSAKLSSVSRAPAFLAHYGEFLHRPAAAPVLPTITMKEVVKALRCMAGKAAGTDGWTAELLLK